MGSGKKGGSGGGSGQDFQVPQGLLQGASSTSGLGQYATSITNAVSALTNWASNLATGQQTNVATSQAYAAEQGPGTYKKGGGDMWSTSFDPTTGLVTYTNVAKPSQTWTSDLSQAGSEMNIDPAVLKQWQGKRDAYLQSQQGGGQQQQQQQQTSVGGTYGDQLASGVTQAQVYDWYKKMYGQDAPDAQTANYAFNQQIAQAQGKQVGTAGSLLSQAYQAIHGEQTVAQQTTDLEKQTQDFLKQAGQETAKYQAQGDTQMTQAGEFFKKGDVQEEQAQQLYGKGYQELSDADKAIVDARALIKMTTTGEGLFPAQAAMIQQAKQSEETQLASTLGAAGLGRSTQLAQLTGAADLASAATAGQLQQGNIQAAEQVMQGALGEQAGAQKTLGLAQTQEQTAAQTYGVGVSEQQIAQQSYALSQAIEKLTLTGQQLLKDEQAQVASILSDVSSKSSGLQKQLWDEAMSGYGMMGQLIDSAGKEYNISTNAYQSILSALEQHGSTEASIQSAQQSADSSATSSLFGALGKILGSVGGAAAGGAAAGAGGSAAGAGISAALTAISFCAVAQEVYGLDGWQWIVFQRWLLFQAPKFLRRLYARHARSFAVWIRNKSRIKATLRFLMNLVINDP